MQKARLIIIFGSQARGTAGRGSDFDVAALSRHPLSLDEKTSLIAAVAKKLRVSEDRVDLIDLQNAPPLLQRCVADEGKLLEGSDEEFTRFRVLAWKRYQDTAKFRRLREKNLANHYAK